MKSSESSGRNRQNWKMALTTENPFLTAFRQYQNIGKLTRDILIELVDHIKIHEGGYISIVFRFADELCRIPK